MYPYTKYLKKHGAEYIAFDNIKLFLALQISVLFEM